MTAIPLYQIDAFASRAFAGNPAAVCPLQAWLPDTTMQAIAAENNLAETAFFVATPGAAADYHLRWFTPEVEVELCGHATLASAHVIFEHLEPGRSAVRFSTQVSGVLSVAKQDDRLALDFPSMPPEPVVIDDRIAYAVGMRPMAAARSGDYILLRFRTQADVAGLAPDMRALRATGKAIIATAPGAEPGVDFVSRFFAPALGVDEDPVTGSAHCRLIPYWAAEAGRTTFFARQISARGGELWCALEGERVRIAGHCVETIRGQFFLPR